NIPVECVKEARWASNLHEVAGQVVGQVILNKPESGEGRRIIVVRRPNDAFHRNRYIIHLLMEQWRQWGFRVDVSDQADTPLGPLSIVIPHLDATRTPAEYDACFARCAVVVSNRAVTDISKRRVSE